MRAPMVEALTPFPFASSANRFFHASKPAAVLPHCAAPALLVIHTNATKTATVTVLSCSPLVIANSFHTLCIRRNAGSPCGDEASSPALTLFKIRARHVGEGLLRFGAAKRLSRPGSFSRRYLRPADASTRV